MNILGLSGLYHDSAACLVQDGRVTAAAQEERFTRLKHDAGLPYHAMAFCLDHGGVEAGQLDAVVFYDKPLTKLARLLATYTAVAPRGLNSFLMAIPVWLREKAWVGPQVERFLRRAGYGRPGRFLFAEHHLSHAAAAFFPSPFEEAAILTVDGVGEWTTTAVGHGRGNRLELMWEQRFPHSLGLLYSAFTYFCGFKVNSGEYKLMGLAPYGEPVYADLIRDKLLDVREDGSFRLNLDYFGYLAGLTMTNARFSELFGGPPRAPESELTRREMDLARSIQEVTEEVLGKMARYARAVTGARHLCLAGGVALNCVANGKLLRAGLFDDLWIQPAAGDAGGALGAALYAWHQLDGHPREVRPEGDAMQGALLGPRFTADEIRAYLDAGGYPYQEYGSAARDELVARAIADGKVVGLFQGRMEFGPRALCNRSILADARSREMQSYLNLATKFRESFRPFAPAVLRERCQDYFEVVRESPYMLLVDRVKAARCLPPDGDERKLPLKEWIHRPRSDIPAVTHVDYSGRLQTVDRARNPRMHSILRAFERLTGEAIVVNTSFNVRGEPIVCTPEDAYRCFMRTGIDLLVLEDFVLHKEQQPAWHEESDWRETFVLD